MRAGILLSMMLWGAGIAAALSLTGCAGMAVGGELGVYRIDSRQSESHTYERNTKPLKCWFVNCDKKTEGEVQGS